MMYLSFFKPNNPRVGNQPLCRLGDKPAYEKNLTSADQCHDLNIVTGANDVRRVCFSRHDVGVDFNGQIIRRNVDGVKQLLDCHRRFDLHILAIDRDLDHGSDQPSSNAASNATLLGEKSNFFVNSQASFAPKLRSIPLSSHSIERGPS